MGTDPVMATNATWSADIRSEATFSAFAVSETGGWEFGHLRARDTLECAGAESRVLGIRETALSIPKRRQAVALQSDVATSHSQTPGGRTAGQFSFSSYIS